MARETTPKITGWTKNGQPIETPDGIHAEDFFRDGEYLGADPDGVEPVFAGEKAMANETDADRKYAVDEIGEGQVAYREYLDSRTPESIAALQAELAQPHPLSPLLSELDQWIVEESTRALGDRGK